MGERRGLEQEAGGIRKQERGCGRQEEAGSLGRGSPLLRFFRCVIRERAKILGLASLKVTAVYFLF